MQVYLFFILYLSVTVDTTTLDTAFDRLFPLCYPIRNIRVAHRRTAIKTWCSCRERFFSLVKDPMRLRKGLRRFLRDLSPHANADVSCSGVTWREIRFRERITTETMRQVRSDWALRDGSHFCFARCAKQKTQSGRFRNSA